MNTKILNYRNTTFLFVGLGCLIMLAVFFIRPQFDFRTPARMWMTSVNSLVTPMFCVWIGGLIRSIWQRPKIWVKGFFLALIPFMYLILVLYPISGINHMWPGYDILMLSLVIMGFLVLPLAKSFKEMGWVSSALFLTSAFCYVGVVRVSDHFSMVNFTLRESEWSVLFFRLMKGIPLAMSMFFLMVFSFSEPCGKIVGRKWVRIAVIVLAVLSGLLLYASNIVWANHLRFSLRYLLVHPLTVYLVFVIVRAVRKLRSGGIWCDVFKV